MIKNCKFFLYLHKERKRILKKDCGLSYLSGQRNPKRKGNLKLRFVMAKAGDHQNEGLSYGVSPYKDKEEEDDTENGALF